MLARKLLFRLQGSIMANCSEISFELVELSGHVVAKGTWGATLRADCLYQCAHLAKPGRHCRLLQGSLEIKPITPLASLDLSLGTCIQVVWLSSCTADRVSQSRAFAAIKADGSVVTWGDADGGGNSSAVAPLLIEGVFQVCGSRRAFAAIKADGSVVTWGDGRVGGNSSAVAPLLTGDNVHVCGNVVTWGDGRGGGNSSDVAPLLTGGVVQVCGNPYAFAAIKADGSVVTWGIDHGGGDSSAVAPLLTQGVVLVC
ncbi:unnamed protein product [Polarella glacialis]|uniref:Uncharacterized protein n=1 Tax=Polarella glacialis TaxID=89957 RepID=A0A813HF39_POLGL|nr:unnamed protein product [Polarella glacialis]